MTFGCLFVCGGHHPGGSEPYSAHTAEDGKHRVPAQHPSMWLLGDIPGCDTFGNLREGDLSPSVKSQYQTDLDGGLSRHSRFGLLAVFVTLSTDCSSTLQNLDAPTVEATARTTFRVNLGCPVSGKKRRRGCCEHDVEDR